MSVSSAGATTAPGTGLGQYFVAEMARLPLWSIPDLQRVLAFDPIALVQLLFSAILGMCLSGRQKERMFLWLQHERIMCQSDPGERRCDCWR